MAGPLTPALTRLNAFDEVLPRFVPGCGRQSARRRAGGGAWRGAAGRGGAWRCVAGRERAVVRPKGGRSRGGGDRASRAWRVSAGVLSPEHDLRATDGMPTLRWQKCWLCGVWMAGQVHRREAHRHSDEEVDLPRDGCGASRVEVEVHVLLCDGDAVRRHLRHARTRHGAHDVARRVVRVGLRTWPRGPQKKVCIIS